MKHGLFIGLVLCVMGTSCSDVVVAVSCEAGSCPEGESSTEVVETTETTETTEITETTETTETTEVIPSDDGPADFCVGKPDGTICESDSSACTIDRCSGEVCVNTPRSDGLLPSEGFLKSATGLKSGAVAIYATGDELKDIVVLLNAGGVSQWSQQVVIGEDGVGKEILQVGSFLLVVGRTEIRPGYTTLTTSGEPVGDAMLNGSDWGDAAIQRQITTLDTEGRLLALVSNNEDIREAVIFRFDGPEGTHIEPLRRDTIGFESLDLRGNWATSGETNYLAGWAPPESAPDDPNNRVGVLLRYRPETLNDVLYLEPEIPHVTKFRLFDVEVLDGGDLAVLGIYVEEKPDDTNSYHYVLRRISAEGTTIWETREENPQFDGEVQWLTTQFTDLLRSESGTLVGIGQTDTSAGKVPLAYAWDETSGELLWSRKDLTIPSSSDTWETTRLERAVLTPENGVLLMGTHVNSETEVDPTTGISKTINHPRVFWTFLDSAGELCNP